MAETTYALRYTGTGSFALALRLGHRQFINHIFTAGESLDVTDLASLGELKRSSELRTLLNAGTFKLEITSGDSDAVPVGGGMPIYLKQIRLDVAGADGYIDISAGTEVDTGWDLPDDAVVLDTFVNVETHEQTGTTKTISAGLLSSESGGDADGFIAALSVASAGYKAAATALDGGSAYFNTTTIGALMRFFVQGADAADRGLFAPRRHVAGSVTAKSVSVTAGDTDWEDFKGSLYIMYIRLTDSDVELT